MLKRLSDTNVKAAVPEPTPYEIRDTDVKGLLLRVQPSGVKSYVVEWGRGKRTTLKPRHPVLTLKAARVQAHDILSDAAKHGTPEAARRKPRTWTLRQFLADEFEPWAVAHLKAGEREAKRVRAAFAGLLNKPLTDVNAWAIEKWRSQRIKAGRAVGTVNREIAALKSALTKAVKAGLLPAHPLASVKARKVDNARVRFLTADEEKRLRSALTERDREGIAARRRGNTHRKARGHELLPVIPIGGYCDHLTPMVLLALNTGLRRGELVALEWKDIDLTAKSLLVRAAAAKSGKSRHVPLNKESVQVLERWQRQADTVGRVFNVRDVKTAWLALMNATAIKGFNFHDLRHSFASKLVMAGVDLNTVRELLGHADLKMTLRYSHLAQEHKAAAVEKLTAAR